MSNRSEWGWAAWSFSSTKACLPHLIFWDLSMQAQTFHFSQAVLLTAPELVLHNPHLHSCSFYFSPVALSTHITKCYMFFTSTWQSTSLTTPTQKDLFPPFLTSYITVWPSGMAILVTAVYLQTASDKQKTLNKGFSGSVTEYIKS